MNIKCPYSKIELQLASLILEEKMKAYISVHGEDAFVKEMEAKAPKAIDLQKVADYHGITKEELLQSPNLESLRNMAIQDLFLKQIQSVKEILDLHEKEAWAFVLIARGELD